MSVHGEHPNLLMMAVVVYSVVRMVVLAPTSCADSKMAKPITVIYPHHITSVQDISSEKS